MTEGVEFCAFLTKECPSDVVDGIGGWSTKALGKVMGRGMGWMLECAGCRK